MRRVGVSFDEREQTWAIKDVSLEVHAREFVSLVGVSGCGKSTVINSVAGFVSVTEGEVMVDGAPVTGPGPSRGVVFQSFVLFPWRTVRGNIAFGPEVRGLKPREVRAATDRFLDLMGLTRYAGLYPAQISGGMQQRVALARVLINDPDVLLMDEPFGSLDAQTRIFMQEAVTNLWEETHKAVLLVTHDIDEAVFLSDRVYVMTAAPGSIRSQIPIDLPRPRRPDIRLTPEFLDYKRRLYEQIREESLKSLSQSPDA